MNKFSISLCLTLTLCYSLTAMDQNPQVLGDHLLQATQDGNNEIVKALLKRGVPVDAKDSLGFTPLMRAAMNGPKDVCKLLLTHNAHAGAKNNFGNTPLMFAAWNGHEDVCKLLLTHYLFWPYRIPFEQCIEPCHAQ